MLVAALDGFDTQAIGYTAPAIAASDPSADAAIRTGRLGGPLGAAIGALSFGPLADLFGRKWFMILAMVVFAIFTDLTSQSTTLSELFSTYRFFCGLGLGGVTPAFLAMGAELAPRRLRDVFVTVLFASFPGGGLHRLTDQRLGHSQFRLASGVLYRRDRSLIAVILTIWLPELIRSPARAHIRPRMKCAARSNTSCPAMSPPMP